MPLPAAARASACYGGHFQPRRGLPVRLKASQNRESLKSPHPVTWQTTPANWVDTAGYTPGLLRHDCISHLRWASLVITQWLLVIIMTRGFKNLFHRTGMVFYPPDWVISLNHIVWTNEIFRKLANDMQDPFKGFNDDDQNNQNGDGPQGLPLPPNYATVVNPETGNMRIAKVGFSWTMFFFPPFPAIFRADWYNLLCILGVDLGASMLLMMTVPAAQTAQFTVSVWPLLQGLLWGSLYNLMYFKHLFNRGFIPADERSRDLLARAHYWSQPKE